MSINSGIRNYWLPNRKCQKLCTNIMWHWKLTENSHKRPSSTNMTNLVQIYIETSLWHFFFSLSLSCHLNCNPLISIDQGSKKILPKHFVTLQAFTLIFRMSCMLFIINGSLYVLEWERELLGDKSVINVTDSLFWMLQGRTQSSHALAAPQESHQPRISRNQSHVARDLLKKMVIYTSSGAKAQSPFPPSYPNPNNITQKA